MEWGDPQESSNSAVSGAPRVRGVPNWPASATGDETVAAMDLREGLRLVP